jgi:hypothetical protein
MQATVEKKTQAVKVAPKAAIPVQSAKTPTTKTMPPKKAPPAPVAPAPTPPEKKRKAAEPPPAKATPVPEPASKKQAKGKVASPGAKTLSSLNQRAVDVLIEQLKARPGKKEGMHNPELYVKILSERKSGPEWLKWLESIVEGTPTAESQASLNLTVVALEIISEKAGFTQINFGELPLLMATAAKGRTATSRLQSYLQCAEAFYSESIRSDIATVIDQSPIMYFNFLKSVVAAQQMIQQPFIKILEQADVKLEYEGKLGDYFKVLFDKKVLDLVYNTCIAIRTNTFEDGEVPGASAPEPAADDEFDFNF